jgi:predicted pyridoxine 5'-phosphate oxidase superfamily flavin-nucleotide-binding protein
MPGFHGGELAVQRRAGVRAAADRLANMLGAPDLYASPGRSLAKHTFAGLTGRDRAGRLWISPLAGPPGFLDVVTARTLRIHAVPSAGDPLLALRAAQPVGLLAIDFATRRRVRVNGVLSAADERGLTIEADQAYANCPRYIQPRVLEPAGDARAAEASHPRRDSRLAGGDVDLIRRAEAFLLGTTHPEGGNDASHRGGAAGFVRVTDAGELCWPDYPGNNLFNSLGNLAVDPTAAVLFADFVAGTTLHLSGTARVDWPDAGSFGDAGAAGRRVRFIIEAVVAGQALPPRPGSP